MSDKPTAKTFTNVLNLPEPIVRAVTNDPYAPGTDFTVTGLIKPPRVSALETLHKAEIVEDVSDRLWALIGQIGHTILERAGTSDLVERRLHISRQVGILGRDEAPQFQSYSISGQMDLWKQTHLLDYKFTSIWTVKDGVKPEWEQQLNLYALICRENSIMVSQAEIVAIFRDWSVGEARREKDYPQRQIQTLGVKLWEPARQEAFLLERLNLHLNARKVLPECTEDERWARPEKWAVMKRGNQRATKLCDSQAEALREVSERGPGFNVERRPGVQTRCLDYCSAAPFCRQFEMLDPAAYQSKLAEKRPTLA